MLRQRTASGREHPSPNICEPAEEKQVEVELSAAKQIGRCGAKLAPIN